jgi:NAD(P)-dependent dehydrogenase (short-subunit alcohol dehydrogenase family)
MGSVVTVKIPAEVATLQSGAGRELNLEVEYGGVMPWPGIGAYRSSKYALEGMSATLHLEVARFGIRVIVIQPGRVQTNYRRWSSSSRSTSALGTARRARPLVVAA